MLPILAQNNAVADFTTAAVEIRGSGRLSEIDVRTSREKWKIFSE